MSRSVSIRASLLRNLLALVGVLGLTVFATTFLGEERAVRSLATSLMTAAVGHTEAELQRFFEPVSQDLLEMRRWGESGLLPTDDPETLRPLLGPIVAANPRIAAVSMADESGRSYLLMERGGSWQERRASPEAWGKRERVRRWRRGEMPVTTEEPTGYDPRERPWYRGALEEPGRVYWTQPYEFFTTGEFGITKSVAFDVGDGVRRLAAIDVRLEELSAFTQSLRVTERGAVFVLTAGGRLIGLPGPPVMTGTPAGAADFLRSPTEIGTPVLVQAIARAQAALVGDEVWRFASQGERWWLQARRLTLVGREHSVVVVVPESDLLGNVRLQRAAVVGALVVALALAAAQAVRLARRYSRPIESLVRESERIGRGELDDGEPIESRVGEIGRLSAAQDRMRKALRVLLKLERDLQIARRIQRATFPQAMPDLDGYEVAGWSEPADETGGDTYDVFELRDRSGAVPVSTARDERVLLLLADATGHGIGPALSATEVRAMLRMGARLRADLPTVARHLNEQLCADLDAGRFVAAWIGELDASEHTLTSFAAGQGPIFHYRAAENRVERLMADTPPFGIEPALGGTSRVLALGRGDVVAVLSDGVLEARNPAGEEFGEARIEALMRSEAARSAGQLLAALREALRRFSGGIPASDDQTAVIVTRR